MGLYIKPCIWSIGKPRACVFPEHGGKGRMTTRLVPGKTAVGQYVPDQAGQMLSYSLELVGSELQTEANALLW